MREPMRSRDVGENPLTYGMAALRRCLCLGDADAAGAVPPFLPSLMVLAGFGLATFALAVTTARRRALWTVSCHFMPSFYGYTF